VVRGEFRPRAVRVVAVRSRPLPAGPTPARLYWLIAR
jgi:hypothetical protein